MPTDDLSEVRRATARRMRSKTAWHTAIREAVASGQSLRAVADAAGITHVRVLQITRGE